MNRYPELTWLSAVVGENNRRKLSAAAGGWRGLSVRELDNLGLSTPEKRSVLAIQRLTALGYPSLVRGDLSSAEEVTRVYAARLGGLAYEVLLTIAVDGQNRFMGEFEVARGGLHGAAVTPADVFRPLIRAGASAVILVHNHPSGDPQPSPEDVALTSATSLVGGLLGIPLVDHVIIGGHGGGAASLWQLGLAFGHAWHSTIGHLLMLHQKRQEVRVAELRDYFALALDREIKDDGPPVLFEDDEDMDALLLIAGRMLEAFLERVTLPDRVFHVELPFRLELFHPETGEVLPMPLIGAMDAVVELSRRREIWELKSGKKRWAQDAVLYDFQATAYRMAERQLNTAQHGRSDAGLKLIVTTKSRTPDVQVEDLVRNEADERDLAETAASVVRAVRAGCFHPVRSWMCGQCEYADVCR